MALDPKEEARRLHNAQVRADAKEYKDQIRKVESTIRKSKTGLETEVPMKVLNIISDIVETQNKGVPLSAFQNKMLNSLFESFDNLNEDELKKPRLSKHEDGMYIKDVRVLTPDGKTNFMDFQASHAYENQTIETLFPLGDTTYHIIDMISETISENAKLVEEINKNEHKEQEQTKQKKYFEEQQKGEDQFQNRMTDLKELSENSKTKNSEIISRQLSKISDEYRVAKDSTFTPYTDGEKSWIGDVPIVNNGDIENIDRNAETVDASTKREEMFEISTNLPKDVDLVQMLPKNITEQLIEVLSRAVKENSELHNQLYKKEKIQRKFPWKVVSILTAAALAAGIGYGIYSAIGHNNSPNLDNETKIEESIEEDKTEDIKNFSPYSIKFNISHAEDYVDRMTAYKTNIETDKQANDIYQSSVSDMHYHPTHDAIAKEFLSENYNNLQYNEMLDKCKDILTTLKSDETQDFIDKLTEKYDNKTKIPGESYRNWGSLSSYNLTEEEYAQYEELYKYSEDFYDLTSALENEILTNKDFQDILDGKDIKVTQQGIKRIATNAAFALGGTALGSAGMLLILKNAKKKEEKRELERETKKEGGMEQ